MIRSRISQSQGIRMPRPRYRIADDDVEVVHRWIRKRFQKKAWPAAGLVLTAFDRFPHEKPTAKKLQRWCDRFLDAHQWRQLQAVIRSARRDFSQQRSVRLTQNAHEILSNLAKRDKITLSEVVELYLAEVANAPAAKPAGKTVSTSSYKDTPQAPQIPTKSKVIKVALWLRVERNNKFVRGKKKAREEIEWWVLRPYHMEKPEEDGWKYVLSIPYDTDEELDNIIYDEILGEAESIADSRNCFTEADVYSLDDPERSW